jgi:hypothetical protein
MHRKRKNWPKTTKPDPTIARCASLSERDDISRCTMS